MSDDLNNIIRNVDLHLHSTRSDGSISPKELVEMSVNSGLRAIAITDHDEISAFTDVKEYARHHGLEVLPGVELSVHFMNRDIHLLGYCFDVEHKGLRDHLRLFKEQRISRARRIVDKLLAMGIAISFEDVMKNAGGGSVGRPHIAHLLIEHGYVYSFNEAFDKFIGDGRPACVEKYRLEIDEALALIRDAGGVCSIAHPGIQLNAEELVALIKHGAEAIEAVHPKHDDAKTQYYKQLAETYNLVATGGSDFHGGQNGTQNFGRYNVPYDVVRRLKAISECQKSQSA